MNRTRAYYREQSQRAKRRAVRMIRSWQKAPSHYYDGWDSDPAIIGHFARTRRPCSCEMCKQERYNRAKAKRETIL